MPIVVVNGRHPGPTVWLSGAIHGDELNGVEVVRRVLPRLDQRTLRGAVIAVPVVNVFGFVEQSRYLPDGRDLNRSFPGSSRGSMASQLAALFMKEVVMQCQLGIDLHTAAAHRTNAPQIRANLEDPGTLALARAFGTRFVIDARLRDGSLRAAATKQGIKVLVYEAGQIHRFDEEAIEVGVNGVLRVFEELGMGSWETPRKPRTLEVRTTRWVRARRSGLLRLEAKLGGKVRKGELLGMISDATGNRAARVTAPMDGHVIAVNQNPLVSQGDALAHIAG
ncbi:MAG TPA: succinylglutamate desuccinylase/aspartoacylase family protein [Acidimicrobiia bacterium]|nr:succinylglutamate desuccinylase/aspartoacylase family protein [Acidimicrobiia bacterium]